MHQTVLVVIIFFGLLACKPRHQFEAESTINTKRHTSKQSVDQVQLVAAEKISPEVESFINKDCSSKFSEMNLDKKQECYQKITKACSHIDIFSEEIEQVPEWRPEKVPAAYFSYLKSIKLISTEERKNQYTCALLSYLYEQNNVILLERQRVKEMEQGKASPASSFHGDIDRKHLIQKYELDEKATWEDFKMSVDIIPNSIILAQGAIESAYLTSRYAKLANNIFGRKAKSSCDLGKTCVNSLKNKNDRFMMYSNLEEAISDQFRYLNRHPNYKAFRLLRSQQRKIDGVIDAGTIVFGLGSYCPDCSNYGLQLYNAITQDSRWYVYDNLIIYSEEV